MKNKAEVNYFGKLKTPLKVLGISLTRDEGTLYKIYSFVIVSTSLSYGAILFNEIFKHDFLTLINTLLYQSSVCIAITKTTVILQKRFKLARLLEALENKPFLPDPERGGEIEVKLVNECVWITNLQSILYWVLLFLTMVFGVTVAIIKRVRSSDPNDWEFPYGPITIINVTYSPNFEIILAYQVASMGCFAGYFCATDLLAAATLAHISCQFKILQNYIKNVVRLTYKEMLKRSNMTGKEVSDFDASLIPWKYLKRSLTNIVEYHLAIINIAEELEGIFSGLLLIVFVSTLAMVALMIYRVSLIPFSDTRIFAAIGESLIGLGQTILICFWGEQIINESKLVANAVFEMDFVGTDVRFQKGLILIIQRSQKPVCLTAKRFTTIGLSTFAWIMQKSYGAFMVLKNAKTQGLQPSI